MGAATWHFAATIRQNAGDGQRPEGRDRGSTGPRLLAACDDLQDPFDRNVPLTSADLSKRLLEVTCGAHGSLDESTNAPDREPAVSIPDEIERIEAAGRATQGEEP